MFCHTPKWESIQYLVKVILIHLENLMLTEVNVTIVTFIKMIGHHQTKSELIVTAATISVGLT